MLDEGTGGLFFKKQAGAAVDQQANDKQTAVTYQRFRIENFQQAIQKIKTETWHRVAIFFTSGIKAIQFQVPNLLSRL